MKGSQAEAEAAIEALILDTFGLKAIAVVRLGRDFVALAATNPFPDAMPNMLHLCLTKHHPNPDAAMLLASRALAGGRIAIMSDAIWIDFAGGVGTSKLTPSLLDNAAGSTLTARNWNTVQALIAMTAG